MSVFFSPNVITSKGNEYSEGYEYKYNELHNNNLYQFKSLITLSTSHYDWEYEDKPHNKEKIKFHTNKKIYNKNLTCKSILNMEREKINK